MASSSSTSDDLEEPSGIMVPAQMNIVLLAHKSLVGKACTKKTLNKATIKDIISKAWIMYPDLHISDLGRNMFLFSFAREAHTKEVIW